MVLSGFFFILGASALPSGIAAWMVARFSPQSSGSGIPQVENELNKEWSGDPARIAPVKFFGGILAIGSGLALGREGPTVHIGASIAHLVAKIFRCNENECRVLLAAGAGAGLATAFNAPIAGAVFVLEELVGSFDLDVTIATIGASAGAISFARVFLGQAPDFHIEPLEFPGFGSIPAYVALGVLLGFLGVLYNRAILSALAISARLARIRVEWRAALIGAAIGTLTWFLPALVGGGDNITQQVLSGNVVFATLAAAFLLRFVLGPVSYAARTPGGLFAPLLTIGSQAGLLFGIVWCRWFNAPDSSSQGFCAGGYGRIIWRSCARSHHRHHPDRRTHGKFQLSSCAVGRHFCVYDRCYAPQGAAHLRFLARTSELMPASRPAAVKFRRVRNDTACASLPGIHWRHDCSYFKQALGGTHELSHNSKDS